jgi:hypothetical protein
VRRLAAVADSQRVLLLNGFVAISVSVAALALARPLFATQPTVFRPLDEVAVNAPLPQHGPGPVVSVAVLTNGCDRWVDVEIVAQGPAEYWASVGSVGRETPLAFTVLGSEVRAMQVGVAKIGDPLVGSHVVSSSEPVVERGEVHILGESPVNVEHPDEGASAGVVIRNWAANRAPIEATFRHARGAARRADPGASARRQERRSQRRHPGHRPRRPTRHSRAEQASRGGRHPRDPVRAISGRGTCPALPRRRRATRRRNERNLATHRSPPTPVTTVASACLRFISRHVLVGNPSIGG